MYKDFRNEKEKPQKGVLDEISLANMISLEALVNTLIRNKLITKDELIDETKRVKERWELLKGVKL